MFFYLDYPSECTLRQGAKKTCIAAMDLLFAIVTHAPATTQILEFPVTTNNEQIDVILNCALVSMIVNIYIITFTSIYSTNV